MARKNFKKVSTLDEFDPPKRKFRAVFEVRGRMNVEVEVPWDTTLSRVYEIAEEQFRSSLQVTNSNMPSIGDYLTGTGEFFIETEKNDIPY